MERASPARRLFRVALRAAPDPETMAAAAEGHSRKKAQGSCRFCTGDLAGANLI